MRFEGLELPLTSSTTSDPALLDDGEKQKTRRKMFQRFEDGLGSELVKCVVIWLAIVELPLLLALPFDPTTRRLKSFSRLLFLPHSSLSLFLDLKLHYGLSQLSFFRGCWSTGDVGEEREDSVELLAPLLRERKVRCVVEARRPGIDNRHSGSVY